jgi:hypothetical protein
MLFSEIFALFAPPNTCYNFSLPPFFIPTFISQPKYSFFSITSLHNVDGPLNPTPILNSMLQTMTNHKNVLRIDPFAFQLVTQTVPRI